MPITPDQNPLFRKVVQPWYDTDIACILTGVFMLLVFVFSFIGVSVALETPDDCTHIWVPGTLLVLSTLVFATTILRLFRRHAGRTKKELP